MFIKSKKLNWSRQVTIPKQAHDVEFYDINETIKEFMENLKKKCIDSKIFVPYFQELKKF